MSKNRLILEMGIFFILVLGTFTYIVIYEKKDVILKPKVEDKLNQYIDKQYTDIKTEIKNQPIQYDKKTDSYSIKVVNINNKHLSFNVSYQNKKIKDSYKKDYLQGNSLYTYFKQKAEKEITNKTEYQTSISFIQTLDQYTEEAKNKIIEINTLKETNIYNLSVTMKTKKITEENICKKIKDYEQLIQKLKYDPQEYEFLIVNTQNKKITTSIQISHLTSELIENNLEEIMTNIIQNNETIKEKYSIDYQYVY